MEQLLLKVRYHDNTEVNIDEDMPFKNLLTKL